MADEWQEAPPPRRGGRDWEGIAAKLRARPGKWLLVEKQAPRSLQEAVNRGRIAVLRNDADWTYRCETRNTTDRKIADIWMSAERKKEA